MPTAADAACLRFADSPAAGSPILPVILGIDFGTSTTKAVVRVDGYERFHPDPVPLIPSTPEPVAGQVLHRMLLPSALRVGDGDTLRLPGDTSDDRLFLCGDLKRRLSRGAPIPMPPVADRCRQVAPEPLAVAYLALVLRRVRAWFLSVRKGRFPGASIRWSVNLGLPSADCTSDSLCDRYLSVLQAAWLLSLENWPEGLPLTRAETSYVDARDNLSRSAPEEGQLRWAEAGRDKSMCLLGLVPEVLAEVAHYLTSRQWRPGLHVVVNVGAGTLDACCFRALPQKRDQPRRLVILERSVRPLGAHELHEEQAAAAYESLSAVLNDCDRATLHRWLNQFPVDAQPRPLSALVRDSTRESFIAWEAAGVAFAERVTNTLAGEVVSRVVARLGVGLRERNLGLRFFVSGGGSQRPEYAKASEVCRKRFLTTGLGIGDAGPVAQLPLPEGFPDSFDDVAALRYSVAWGLSLDLDTHGEVYADSHDVSALPPKPSKFGPPKPTPDDRWHGPARRRTTRRR